MTITTDTNVDVTAEDRAARLDAAGDFWTKRITSDAGNAQLTYVASGTAEGSVASRITAGRHEFIVDEPTGLAGDDVAASPVEYALGALISCQVVVYRLYAHQLGIPFETIDIDAEGDLDVRGLFGADENVRPGFSAIRLTIRITGAGTAEQYEELRRVVDARCPVLDLFSNPTPVTAVIVAG
jgi:putative redox protein